MPLGGSSPATYLINDCSSIPGTMRGSEDWINRACDSGSLFCFLCVGCLFISVEVISPASVASINVPVSNATSVESGFLFMSPVINDLLMCLPYRYLHVSKSLSDSEYCVIENILSGSLPRQIKQSWGLSKMKKAQNTGRSIKKVWRKRYVASV